MVALHADCNRVEDKPAPWIVEVHSDARFGLA